MACFGSLQPFQQPASQLRTASNKQNPTKPAVAEACLVAVLCTGPTPSTMSQTTPRTSWQVWTSWMCHTTWRSSSTLVWESWWVGLSADCLGREIGGKNWPWGGGNIVSPMLDHRSQPAAAHSTAACPEWSANADKVILSCTLRSPVTTALTMIRSH
jgi:hypothetical protein